MDEKTQRLYLAGVYSENEAAITPPLRIGLFIFTALNRPGSHSSMYYPII